jgi:hypothetical protein
VQRKSAKCSLLNFAKDSGEKFSKLPKPATVLILAGSQVPGFSFTPFYVLRFSASKVQSSTFYGKVQSTFYETCRKFNVYDFRQKLPVTFYTEFTLQPEDSLLPPESQTGTKTRRLLPPTARILTVQIVADCRFADAGKFPKFTCFHDLHHWYRMPHAATDTPAQPEDSPPKFSPKSAEIADSPGFRPTFSAGDSPEQSSFFRRIFDLRFHRESGNLASIRNNPPARESCRFSESLAGFFGSSLALLRMLLARFPDSGCFVCGWLCRPNFPRSSRGYGWVVEIEDSPEKMNFGRIGESFRRTTSHSTGREAR